MQKPKPNKSRARRDKQHSWSFRAKNWFADRVLRGFLWLMLSLPYNWRVPLAGWLVSAVAPLAGYRKRVRDNLALVCPDLDPKEVARIARAVPDNVGRTIIEMYSGAEFTARARQSPIRGPGMAAIEEARAKGRPILLITGHFGNYNAGRAALVARGIDVGGLYQPMKNPYFNEHYVRAMESMSKPIFPRNKQGMAAMVRFLRDGGMLGILIDQHMGHGEWLSFFGKPAKTALSAAELALRYDALVVPIYALRKENGLDFEIISEAPIPHGDPVAMTQALNDSLEAIVRQHMDQWFWIHRRWK